MVPYLLDGAGRRYDPSPSPGQPAFDVRLAPGDVVATDRVFMVPGAVPPIGVVVAREGDFAFPRCCIFGQGLFRRPPIDYARPSG